MNQSTYKFSVFMMFHSSEFSYINLFYPIVPFLSYRILRIFTHLKFINVYGGPKFLCFTYFHPKFLCNQVTRLHTFCLRVGIYIKNRQEFPTVTQYLKKMSTNWWHFPYLTLTDQYLTFTDLQIIFAKDHILLHYMVLHILWHLLPQITMS